MNYLLEIRLRSATSPGSGEGWAGMIDSDIIFDELGLPYIPARRIRGILREMAYDVGVTCGPYLKNISPPFSIDDVDKLFGNPGQSQASLLRIENAYLEDYQHIRQWIDWTQRRMPEIITPERVVAVFTHLRQQTAIEATYGVAKPGSLRTTRVLNRNQKFISQVYIESDKPGHEALIALAVQITRYLGSKRNRGLGKVKCRLLDAQNTDVSQKWLDQIKSDFIVEE